MLVGSVPRARLEEVIALQEEMVMRTLDIFNKENYFNRMFNSLVTRMGKFKEKYLVEKDDEASVSRYKYIVEWRRRARTKGLPDDGMRVYVIDCGCQRVGGWRCRSRVRVCVTLYMRRLRLSWGSHHIASIYVCI